MAKRIRLTTTIEEKQVPTTALSLDDDEDKEEEWVHLSAAKVIGADAGGGGSWRLSMKECQLSGCLRKALEGNSHHILFDAPKREFDLPIPSACLSLIVRYLKHHQGESPRLIEQPLCSNQMKDVCVDAWDAENMDLFCDEHEWMYAPLRRLIDAVSWLDIPPLLDLVLARLTMSIKLLPISTQRLTLANSIPMQRHTVVDLPWTELIS